MLLPGGRRRQYCSSATRPCCLLAGRYPDPCWADQPRKRPRVAICSDDCFFQETAFWSPCCVRRRPSSAVETSVAKVVALCSAVSDAGGDDVGDAEADNSDMGGHRTQDYDDTRAGAGDGGLKDRDNDTGPGDEGCGLRGGDGGHGEDDVGHMAGEDAAAGDDETGFGDRDGDGDGVEDGSLAYGDGGGGDDSGGDEEAGDKAERGGDADDDPNDALTGGGDEEDGGDGGDAPMIVTEPGDDGAPRDGADERSTDCDEDSEHSDAGSGDSGDDGGDEGDEEGGDDASAALADDSDDSSKAESVDAPPTRARQLCWRLPPKKGRCRWVIAGPVRDHGTVDVRLFTTALVVESVPGLSSREVYARAVPMLVKKGVYSSVAAAHESVLFVAANGDGTSSSAGEPSWAADPSGLLPVRRILDRAAVAMVQSGGRVGRGYVKFVSFVPLASHPWYAYAVRLRSRRDERRGAVAYRRALSRLTDDDERRLLRAGNSAALAAVRHATTYDVRSPADKARGLRPTKKRPWRGIGAPDVIPSRKRLICLKRRVFERCSRVDHALLTLDTDGQIVTWTYVRDSGLSGIRLYKATDGTVKRLASHSHKQRKPDQTANVPLPGTRAESGGAGVVARESQETASGSRTPGVQSGPARGDVPVRGTCPVPGQRHHASGDTADATPADLFSQNSLLGDHAHAHGTTDKTGDRLTAEQLTILRSSTLENADGTAPEVVVAVQFDPVAAMAAAIARRTVPCTADDVLGADAAWTLASDGGPIRRSSITLFTLTLSAPWLFRGRTAMIPFLYILAGEHNMHSALGDRLDALLGEAISASYEVPLSDGGQGGAGDEAESGGAAQGHVDDDDCDLSVCDWTGPSLLRIVGNFAMLAHIMGMTGGSDDSRCPFWWPCAASDFLSLTAPVCTDGRTRTVSNCMRQWEFVCWQLARWCTLRDASTSVGGGSVLLRCPACRTTTPVPTAFQRRVPCLAPGCEGTSMLTFPVVSPTPLTNTLHRLRRRAGGVRGYPVVRCVPIVLQVPVLHCTGSLLKKITHFFLAELGDGPRTVARQGMYGVTGRSTLRQLYLREHIKLAALILACEDIVGVQVDGAILSMWSVALLLTAAWRQALTGEIGSRAKYVAVLELAAGLLAPLWSALKPLDKESKGTGVTSLYLHAALVHARASMADNSAAPAIVTDDHAEGAVREIGRHCGTRVNNVARAQAVTEFQALADDDAVAKPRTGFAAEVMVYTESVQVCDCVESALSAGQKGDLDEAVKRAESGGVLTTTPADTEEGTPLTLHVPDSLVYRPSPGASGVKSWESKEAKVAAALKNRMRVVKVCICGRAWGRDVGALGRRLAALRSDDGESSTSTPLDAASLMGHFSRTDAPVVQQPPRSAPAGARHQHVRPPRQPVRRDVERGSAGPVRLLNQDDARLWMHRHSATCLGGTCECDGTCEEPPGAGGDAGLDSNGPLPEQDDDSGDDGIADHLNRGSRPENRRSSALGSGGSSDAVPFLVSEALKDPVLQKYAPPSDLLKRMLCDGGGGSWDGDVDADAVRERIREEDTLLRLFLERMQQASFIDWAKSENVYLGGMRDAVKSVLTKLHDMSASLPGSGAFTF